LTLCRSLHAEALQAIASEGLAQGPYVAVRAGFAPTSTLPMCHHTQQIESVTAVYSVHAIMAHLGRFITNDLTVAFNGLFSERQSEISELGISCCGSSFDA